MGFEYFGIFWSYWGTKDIVYGSRAAKMWLDVGKYSLSDNERFKFPKKTYIWKVDWKLDKTLNYILLEKPIKVYLLRKLPKKSQNNSTISFQCCIAVVFQVLQVFQWHERQFRHSSLVNWIFIIQQLSWRQIKEIKGFVSSRSFQGFYAIF